LAQAVLAQGSKGIVSAFKQFLEIMLAMEAVSNQYTLPTLLGNDKQLQFWREVEREPYGFTFAKLKESKWAGPELPLPAAKKKLSKAKLQKPAEVQKSVAAKPNTLDRSSAGRSSSSPAKPERSASNAHHHSLACSVISKEGHVAGQLMSNAPQKSLMGAVCCGNLKRAEELFSEYGPSLLGGLSSHAIQYATRVGNHEMCNLLVAQGKAHGSKKGCQKQLASHLNNEYQEAPRRGRSSSVPDISLPISVPKREASTSRPRRKSIY